MNIRQAISNVKSILKKINADNRLTNKEVYTVLHKHAIWITYRQSESLKLGRENRIYQAYKCAQVIDVAKIDPCCKITTRCKIKRTKDRIPKIYEDSLGIIIKAVSSIDGSTELNHSTILSYPTKKNSPWLPKTEKFYFFEDGYLYGDLPKSINILAAFMEQVDCTGCKRFLDKEWMVSQKTEAEIIDFTIKELAMQLQIPSQEKIDKNENK